MLTYAERPEPLKPVMRSQLRPSEKHRNNQPATPEVYSQGIMIQVMGDIFDFDPVSGKRGYWFRVRGVDPNREYDLNAWYPDGSPYDYLASTQTDKYGAAPGMSWDPFDTRDGKPDPEGTYKLRYTDRASRRWVEIEFDVCYGSRVSPRRARKQARAVRRHAKRAARFVVKRLPLNWQKQLRAQAGNLRNSVHRLRRK